MADVTFTGELEYFDPVPAPSMVSHLRRQAVMLSCMQFATTAGTWWVGIMRGQEWGEWQMIVVDDGENQAVRKTGKDFGVLANIMGELITHEDTRPVSIGNENLRV